jgi:hypothetical protein
MFAGLAKISGACPAYGIEETTYALQTAGAKFLMTTPDSMYVAKQNTEAVGLPKENIFSSKPSNWIHNHPRPDAHGENNLQRSRPNGRIQDLFQKQKKKKRHIRLL